MDIEIERSFWEKYKSKIFLGLALLVFLSIAIYYFRNNFYEIQRKNIKLATVSYGEFQEIIIVNGNVQPKRTILIDANEGGRVIQKMKEDGDTVKASEPLLILQNEALVLDYMQRETQVVEQLNNLRNTQITLHQNLRNLEDEYARTEVEEKKISRDFKGDSAIYLLKGLAYNEYKTQKEQRDFTVSRVNVLQSRIKEDKAYLEIQNNRILASIELMERNLAMIRSKIEEMKILVPLSGRLTSFDIEVGQVLSPSEIIGRVDVPGEYKVVAQVDQHYLNRVVSGAAIRMNINEPPQMADRINNSIN